MAEVAPVSPVSFRFEGSKLIVAVDLNKDSQPVLTVTLDLTEVADEVLAALGKKA